MKLLSLVVPVYFEQECIEEFISQTVAHLDEHEQNFEIVFIDDGSTDKTVELIKEHAKKDTRIKLLEFSYNHGKELAVTAGISHARGDAIVYMDPDLQDPPEKIIDFVNELDKGYDLVFGIREERYGNPIDKLLSETFWFIIRRLSGEKIPKGIAVMRIFNRKFADQFLKYGEVNRFIEGIFMDISYNWTTINVPHRQRFAGVSKFNFTRKLALAMRAVLDYSDKPLEAVSLFGFFIFALGLIAAFIVLTLVILGVDFKLGWPSMFTILVMGFGIQLFLIGVVAKYIGNIYKEVKRRPLFSIKETTNIDE